MKNKKKKFKRKKSLESRFILTSEDKKFLKKIENYNISKIKEEYYKNYTLNSKELLSTKFEEILKRNILKKSESIYSTVKKKDGTGSIYPDHIIWEEKIFSYLLQNSFTKKQKDNILYDHGENEEYYYTHYNPNNLIKELLSEIKNYKPFSQPKDFLDYCDMHCCCH